jgi:tripartite-type tricarboxylate transporter receptor subunit TctC
MDLAYDVLNDFEPVALLADTPIWMVARNTLPPKDLTELIAWLRQNPGKATAGTVGVGGASDIAGTYFQNVTGTKFVFVPYRGAAPLNQDLVAGHIDINLGMAAAGYPLMRNGQIKAYATMAKSRWWAAPEYRQWRRLGFPDSTLRSGMGSGPEQQSPEALGAHQQAEIKKWWPIIKAAGIKAY